MTDDQVLERAAEIIEERCKPMVIVRGWVKQLRRLAVQIRAEQEARARRRIAAGLPADVEPYKQLLDDPSFERRLRELMRRHPHMLESWIRQWERVHGGQPFHRP